ncbi:MAG: hypothetical protein U0790_02980 [Isosphaeraceae bacterium]
MITLRRTLMLLVVILSGSWTAGSADAEEHYFFMIFGSQSSPKLLRYSHTWATFVRAVGEGPDLGTYQLEVNTISWFPRTLDVKVFRPWPEPGVNLDLYQTIRCVSSQRESITMWGPFVCVKEVWDRALVVRNLLESGAAQYRAISTRVNLLISDCIHAVAAVDPEMGRGHYPLIRIGKPASRYIAHEVMQRSVYDQYQYDASWLFPRLSLNQFPIEVVPPRAISKAPCGLCKHED